MNAIPYADESGNIYKFGEYYPIELSPFGYNETYASELVPLNKEQALQKGYLWQDNTQRTTGRETLLPENIPDSINEVKDEILNETLVCIECERNYRINPNELIFYKKMRIPIPRRCFHCRHNNRVKKTNPFKQWHRSCMCDKTNHFHGEGNPRQGGARCTVEFETSYAPDRPEIVYCEKCYQAEVY